MKTQKIARSAKNLAALVALSSSLVCGAEEAKKVDMTPHGRVEVMAGADYTSTDATIYGSLPYNFGYFGRNTTSFNYKSGQITPFAFIDLSRTIGKGFDAVYETQFIDNSNGPIVTPRAGIQTFRELGKNLTLYTIGTANFPTQRDPEANGEIVATLRYSPQLTKSIKGIAQLETVTNFGSKGLNFASQQIRLGAAYKRLEAGAAVNFCETSSSFSYTPGFFVGFNF